MVSDPDDRAAFAQRMRAQSEALGRDPVGSEAALGQRLLLILRRDPDNEAPVACAAGASHHCI